MMKEFKVLKFHAVGVPFAVPVIKFIFAMSKTGIKKNISGKTIKKSLEKKKTIKTRLWRPGNLNQLRECTHKNNVVPFYSMFIMHFFSIDKAFCEAEMSQLSCI